MNKRWDIRRADERDGKTYWTPQGVVFAGKDGRLDIILKTLFGEVRLVAFPHDADRDGAPFRATGARLGRADLDDETPF